MNKKLPIQASLVTREGFQKPIVIDQLKPVIYYPKFAKMDFSAKTTSEIDFAIQDEKMEFHLEKYKEVKQKNGLHHIVATYREM
jgi:hypothetical protein